MPGVGVSRAPLVGEAYHRPLGMMRDYVDALTAAGILADRLCVAANGPKMLELSRDLTAGADHVCLQVLRDRAAGMMPPPPAWRPLATALREEV